VTVTVNLQRYLLLIERGDNGAWATPGGFADQDEPIVNTALRECREESGVDVSGYHLGAMKPRYIHDSRASGEAWIVTVPVWFDLGELSELPRLQAGDDARDAMWVAANTWSQFEACTNGALFGAHLEMLREFLEA
jgi:ADP-ribose pyrophosphatase